MVTEERMPLLPVMRQTPTLTPEWGQEVVNYLAALNTKIDGVNDNINRHFEKAYPNVDFDDAGGASE